MKDEKSSNGSSEEDEDFYLNFEELMKKLSMREWIRCRIVDSEDLMALLIYFSLTKYEGNALRVKSFFNSIFKNGQLKAVEIGKIKSNLIE